MIFPFQIVFNQNAGANTLDWYLCVSEKVSISLFHQQSDSQNSERYYLDSVIIGQVNGWHEMKYLAL